MSLSSPAASRFQIVKRAFVPPMSAARMVFIFVVVLDVLERA